MGKKVKKANNDEVVDKSNATEEDTAEADKPSKIKVALDNLARLWDEKHSLLKLTTTSMAQDLGVSQSTVYRQVSGKPAVITEKQVFIWARKLQVEPQDIMPGIKDAPEPKRFKLHDNRLAKAIIAHVKNFEHLDDDPLTREDFALNVLDLYLCQQLHEGEPLSESEIRVNRLRAKKKQ